MMAGNARGFALAELMVGLAVGLFIVATAALALTRHTAGHKRLLAEVQVQQDLRAAAELIVRELRRAGHWEGSPVGMWSDDAPASPNPYSDLLALPNCNSNVAVPFEDTGTACGVLFSYDRPDTSASAKQIGFRHHGGAVEMRIGQGGWQAVTDAAAVQVTGFTLTMHRQVLDRTAFCASKCPTTQPECGPRQFVRDLDVTIVGRSAVDPAVVRSLSTSVHLRNDLPVGSCP